MIDNEGGMRSKYTLDNGGNLVTKFPRSKRRKFYDGPNRVSSLISTPIVTLRSISTQITDSTEITDIPTTDNGEDEVPEIDELLSILDEKYDMVETDENEFEELSQQSMLLNSFP